MFDYYEYLKKWEVRGIYWIIIVGSILHFVYDISGKSPIVGAFSPINESLWEHLKLGYFPLLAYSIVEYWFIRNHINNFFFAKSIGIIAMSLFIIIVFYTYNFIAKDSNFLVDITSFILGAIICQKLSLRIMKLPVSKGTEVIGFITFLLIGFIFVYFTFSPPKLHIFMDPKTEK